MSNQASVGGEGSKLELPPLKIAVEGCGHGSLDYIYTTLENSCGSRGWTVAELDFLIICGDFQEHIARPIFDLGLLLTHLQAARNEADLNCMSIPQRYRNMGDFHEYYSGQKQAPVLTLVIGGNHETSNYFSELRYGGWLAPRIYYLGAANVLRYGPIRIAGLSGIFHPGDYEKPHHERLPYDRNEIRSIYHVRECDVSKLLQVQSPVDIGLSHDWPRRVEWFGDYNLLFRRRPHFLESAKIDSLGSPPAEQVMNHLRPRYWFSGHMHIKYSAVIDHDNNETEDIFEHLDLPHELLAQLPKSMFRATFGEKENEAARLPRPTTTNTVTRFLALDKPGPYRDFLELVEIDPNCYLTDTPANPYMKKSPAGKFFLYYDEEWLSIIRSSVTSTAASDEFLAIETSKSSTSSPPSDLAGRSWIQTNITSKGLLQIPENFEQHAPTYDPNHRIGIDKQPCEFPNSQTEAFCTMLGFQDNFSASEDVDVDEGGEYVVFG